MPYIALAPMDGVTDVAFREIVWRNFAPLNLAFTEFVNVEGLFRAPHATVPKLYISPFEKNIVAQVFGNVSQLEYFKKAAALIRYLGFSGIDLNVGCPYPNVVKNKAGVYLLGKTEMIGRIIDAIREGVENYSRYESIFAKLLKGFDLSRFRIGSKPTSFSVSLKTRLGKNREAAANWWYFLDTLKLDYITIHGRYSKFKHSNAVGWRKLQLVAYALKTPVIGNGGIKTKRGIQRALRYTPEGVMIGRGFIGNPWLEKVDFKTRFETLYQHFKLYVSYFSDQNILPFFKHLVAYVKGFDRAKKLKLELIKLRDAKTLGRRLKRLASNPEQVLGQLRADF